MKWKGQRVFILFICASQYIRHACMGSNYTREQSDIMQDFNWLFREYFICFWRWFQAHRDSLLFEGSMLILDLKIYRYLSYSINFHGHTLWAANQNTFQPNACLNLWIRVERYWCLTPLASLHLPKCTAHVTKVAKKIWMTWLGWNSQSPPGGWVK